MAMIGRGAAVAEVGEHRHELHGPVAFAAWLGVHAALMSGVRNRVEAFINWGWDYFAKTGGPQILDQRSDAARIDWDEDPTRTPSVAQPQRTRSDDVTTISAEPRTGVGVVATPTLNKGTAFTEDERRRLGLQGLLPPHVETLDEQVARAYEAYGRQPDDLARHVFLRESPGHQRGALLPPACSTTSSRCCRSSTRRPSAQGCQQFSHIYSHPRGLFISYPAPRRHPHVAAQPPARGDRRDRRHRRRAHPRPRRPGRRRPRHPDRQALALLADRRDPARAHAADRPRRRHQQPGAARRSRVPRLAPRADHRRRVRRRSSTRFVEAVKDELPDVCLQWEDFASAHASPILRALPRRPADVQRRHPGHRRGGPGRDHRRDQRRPAASSSTSGSCSSAPARPGSAWPATCAPRSSRDGLSEEEARRRFWIVDKDGLLVRRAAPICSPIRRSTRSPLRTSRLAARRAGQLDLAQVVAEVHPTIMIGLSTVHGAFTEAIVRDMAAHVERPIIFPLSNPTSHSEATGEDLIRWTDGRALVASGSPFAAGRARRPHDPDRAVQQRLHLPGGRARPGRLRRHPRHRRDDGRRRAGARRELAGAERSERAAAPAAHRRARRRGRDRGRRRRWRRRTPGWRPRRRTTSSGRRSSQRSGRQAMTRRDEGR